MVAKLIDADAFLEEINDYQKDPDSVWTSPIYKSGIIDTCRLIAERVEEMPDASEPLRAEIAQKDARIAELEAEVERLSMESDGYRRVAYFSRRGQDA